MTKKELKQAGENWDDGILTNGATDAIKNTGFVLGAKILEQAASSGCLHLQTNAKFTDPFHPNH